jgi:hypothetical protein
MHHYGFGVPRNDAEAVRWVRLAAEQGDADAQFRLGGMYEYGEGFPENVAEAVKWYRLAAEQGHLDGQLKLGIMYAFGEGVPKDAVQAFKWNLLAAAQGENFFSVQNKKNLSKTMTPDQIAEVHRLAAEWEREQ